MTENATATDPWQNPTSVGLWGPRVTPPPAPEARSAQVPDMRDVRRRQKSWGIGDIFLGIAALILTQVAIAALLVVAAVANVGPRAQEDPYLVLEEFQNVAASATANPAFIVVALITQWFAFLAPPLYAARRKGRGSLANTFGLWFKRVDLALGLGLAVACQMLLALISNVIVPALGIDQTGSDNTGQVTDSRGFMLLILVIGGALIAPILEEIFFRGLVFGALMKRIARFDLFAPADEAQPDVSRRRKHIGIFVSALLSSAFFGSLHITTGEDGQVHLAGVLLLMFQTGLLGFIFAYVTAKVRRLGPAVIAHVAFNSSSIGLTLLLT